MTSAPSAAAARANAETGTSATLLCAVRNPTGTVRGVRGEEPPPSAAHTIAGLVSRLRREVKDNGQALVRRGVGYCLHLGDGVVDADLARSRVDSAARAAEGGDHARASELAQEALLLWRGSALADTRLEGAARHDVEQLDELRLRAYERWAEAELALGRHEDAIRELRPVVGERPYREGAVAQLMLALYRSGRQAEALEVYERTRRALAEDLGLQPSAELRRLSGEITRQDPRLATPTAAEPSRSSNGGRATACEATWHADRFRAAAASDRAGEPSSELSL